MNIYKVYRTDEIGYDEFDEAVIVAKDEKQARQLSPFRNSENTETVKVELVNKNKAGIVVASFRAG